MASKELVVVAARHRKAGNHRKPTVSMWRRFVALVKAVR